MKAPDKDSEKRQEKDEFKAVAELLLPHAVPLFLAPSRDSDPKDVICSGSGALIDTGERQLLITCDHVWKRFKQAVNDSAHVICMSMGDFIANISDFEAIDSDETLDIAVLDLSDFKFPDGSDKKFCKSLKWPPNRPQEEEVLVCLGFPGALRGTDETGDRIRFLTTDVTDSIISVSDRHIALADERGLREFFYHLVENFPEELSLGGMSGCPAFVKRSSGFVFVGIVYESSDNSDGIIYVSHADFINNLGRIDWSRVPPL